MTPSEERNEAEDELIAEAIHARIERAAAPARAYGRRAADGLMLTPKGTGMIVALITIILALFSPVFYVRDMAHNVATVTQAVEEIRDAQRLTEADVVEVRSAIAELRVHDQESARERTDHEQRIRALEMSRR